MSNRYALLVGTQKHSSTDFFDLAGTVQDIEELHGVLADASLGAYAVQRVVDAPYHRISEEIGGFLRERKPGDTVLLYISGHGIRSDSGELYFVAENSRREMLEETAVPSTLLAKLLSKCRADQILLLLDCCFAGSYPTGAIPKAGNFDDLAALKGAGRVVIAGTSALDLAFMRHESESNTKSSVFTSAVTLGIRTGDADVDKDGRVTPQDLFTYVSRTMRDTEPKQTPVLLTDGLQGDWTVALNPYSRASATDRVDLPSDDAPLPEAISIADAMDVVLDEIEEISNRGPGEIRGNSLSTGLEALDELTYGFTLGELIFITAPVSVGKSTLALGTLRSASVRSNIPSLLVSNDMSTSEVILRLLSAEAKVPLNHIRNGLMNDDDWAKLARKMGEVSSAPLFIQDAVGENVEQQILAAKRDRDIRLAVIDSLDLAVDMPDPAAILSLSRNLKVLARSQGIVIVATLPDVPEFRSDGRPLGLLDRYADVVVHVDREDVRDSETLRPGEADLSLTKTRRGPVGIATTVAFQGHYSRFVDMAN